MSGWGSITYDKDSTEKKIIYLACPYSTNADRELMVKRFEMVNKASLILMNRGDIIFSPVTMGHPIADCGDLPRTWDFWEQFDRAFLEASGKMYVLMLDGWKESGGVQAEIEIAKELGIEIEYLDYDELCKDSN